MGEITHSETFTAIGTALDRVRKDHPGEYSEPLWGEKDTKHLKNLGFVIGMTDPVKTQWYRVDFDPEKKLHINWEQDTNDHLGRKARLKECYLVRPHILDPEDEMYTWWRSMTLHYCTELPDSIRAKMGGKGVWRGAFWT